MIADLKFAAIRIPDDWEDRTTFQFVSPPETMNVPLAIGSGAQVAATRSNVTLAYATGGQGTIETLMQAQEDIIKHSGQRLQVESREPWRHARYGDVAALDVSYEVGSGYRVRQVYLYVLAANEKIVTITYSCAARDYARKKHELVALLESLELHES